MGPVRAEIEIDAPREEVFEVIADLALRPTFTEGFISELRLARLESTGVGAAARFRFDVRPKGVWMLTEISAVDEPHRLSERGRGGRIGRVPSATEWELTEGPGSLTTLRVVFWTEPTNPLDKMQETVGLSSGSYRRGWQRSLRRLRDIVESGEAPSGRVGVGGGNRTMTGVP